MGFLQSFFGFGQSADIEIKLDGTDTRKLADIKSDDGKKEKFYLYYDGESVTGQVGFFFLFTVNVTCITFVFRKLLLNM